MEEDITITKKEHDDLLQDQKILRALYGAGVDNWEGYDVALDDLDSE